MMKARSILSPLLCAIILIAPAGLLSAATPAEVDNAVRKAIEFLYSTQKDGTWENVTAPPPPDKARHDDVDGGQWGGMTGIATYALLSAEQSPADEHIRQAVDFLKKAKLRGVYAIAMRAQVWPLIPKTAEVREAAKNDARLLMSAVHTKGAGVGQWYYYVDKPNDERSDHSASQFALLGLWACTETGVEIPNNFWKMQDNVWREHQMPDGSWSYVHKDRGDWGKPYLSMTMAGLASLFITKDKIQDINLQNCRGNMVDPNIARGLDWVAQNFPNDFEHPPANAYIRGEGRRNLYMLYGLHRLGLASGYRYFGKSDWFDLGADYLVKSQREDGSWGNTWETSFGLLFLSRGRAPTAFSKLDYGASTETKTPSWNQRPRDLANLTAWMTSQIEKRMNWEILNLDADTFGAIESPVLYISGSDALKLSAEQQTRLRNYVNTGGVILASADCGNSAFAGSIRSLCKTIFPNYEFRELPANHPIFESEQFKRAKWKTKPRILGLSNGVRELVLLVPDADLSRAYHGRNEFSKPELYELAFDIYQYAVGIDEVRRRGQSIRIAADGSIKPQKTLRVARVKYDGNWDPEPAGWPRLANFMHNRDNLDLAIEPVEPAAGALNGYSLAALTGVAPPKLRAAALSELKRFVDSGGTLLVDSAGGNAEFALSMEQQLSELFGQKLSTIDPAHALYTTGDEPLKRVTYRRYARSVLGDLNAPRIRGIEINKRLAVIFSAEDLSTGLVGNPVDGIIGYSPNSALQIVRRILLQQK